MISGAVTSRIKLNKHLTTKKHRNYTANIMKKKKLESINFSSEFDIHSNVSALKKQKLVLC
jgi:hypothetical protein